MRQIKADLRTLVIALLAVAIVYNGPSLAHGVQHALFAHKAGVADNAKRFDGKTPSRFRSNLISGNLAMDVTGASQPIEGVDQSVTYSGTVTNQSPFTARQVEVVITALDGGGSWGTVSHGSDLAYQLCDDPVGAQVVCRVGTMAPGASKPISARWILTACGADTWRASMESEMWNWDTNTGNDLDMMGSLHCTT